MLPSLAHEEVIRECTVYMNTYIYYILYIIYCIYILYNAVRLETLVIQIIGNFTLKMKEKIGRILFWWYGSLVMAHRQI